jgi:hypothetical protein
MGIHVRRRGSKSDLGSYRQRMGTRLDAGPPYAMHRVVIIGFRTNPKGEKPSDFDVSIVPENFKMLAQAMMHADSEAAIKAFGTALQDGISEPIEPGMTWVPRAA